MSLYERRSGDSSPELSSLSLSGGRPGGFSTWGVGITLTLGLTLTLWEGIGASGAAKLAEARGLAWYLGRACSAQVMVGSFLSLQKDWSGLIHSWVDARSVSGPSLKGVGFDEVDLYGSRCHLSNGLEIGVWSVCQNFLVGSVSVLSLCCSKL